ncbi:MAG: hypothetical protein JNG89_17160, partial [Planctomycetaceae bacterium]|nr:hypothetical protein [Planctomycetaceae bacterium]
MSRASRRPSCAARVWIALCVTLALAVGVQCQADPLRGSPDERYLTGLRSRRLFSLAERYCLQRLADPALTPSNRATLTIELSRCFAEHATWRSGREQDELWQRAAAVVAETLSDELEPSRRAPLVLQAANVAAARGAWLRWTSELAPYDDALRQQAIAHLQASFEAQRQAETSITGLDRNAAQAAGSDLRLLSAEARFQTAVTSLDLARLLPTGIERTAALHEADTRLTELSRNPFFESRRTAARLLSATTARLRDDHHGAMQLLDALSSTDHPVAIRQQAAAESMRVELDRGKPDAALLQLAEVERSTGSLSEELLCVGVEARLAARRQSLQQGDTARAATLLEQAVAIETQIQGPWRARSTAVLEFSRSIDEHGAELAPLILAARAAQQHGDADAAITRYRESALAAQRSGRDELALDLQFSAASLLLQAGRHEDAARDFLAVADAPITTRSADAHLLFAYCRGKQWEARPT